MGLGIFVYGDDPDKEIDGIFVGSSSDYQRFRGTVSNRLDPRFGQTRFPSLINADLWEGRWDAVDAATLEQELGVIASEFSRLPHEPQDGRWQRGVRNKLGLKPTSLLESFTTIDGELLVLRMLSLAQVAQRENGYLQMG